MPSRFRRRPLCVERLEDRLTPAPMTFPVTNTADEGTGSLRQAILDAMHNLDASTISFNIAPGGAQTIRVGSTTGQPLPALTGPITLDGTTQPGFSAKPLIELDGSLAGAGSDGLVILNGLNTVRGLIINRFGGSGIALRGAGAVENRVQGNYIGTDSTGSVSLGNFTRGVEISDGASHNIIGTDGDGVSDNTEGNVISANGQLTQFVNGNIQIFGFDTRANVVAGNIIGLNAAGTAALDNHFANVRIFAGASQNRVGTDANGVSDELERNIISGAGQSGVVISGDGAVEIQNVVAGNYIGTDITGTIALPNADNGIQVKLGAQYTQIGAGGLDATINARLRNVIAGNGLPDAFPRAAIDFQGDVTGSSVAGNYIGLDASGTAPLGNLGIGIWNESDVGITIGGTVPGLGNVISGNASDGIRLSTGGNVVQGNFIGTDATGTLPLGNHGDGIRIDPGAENNTIGGAVSSARNVIAANEGAGVEAESPRAARDVQQGNLIGTDVTGLHPLPNAQAIVFGERSNRAYVTTLYVTVLSRTCDAVEQAFWVDQLRAGVARADIAKRFWESPEHRGGQVEQYYLTYLHRGPDASGSQAWIQAFLDGATETDVASGFLASAEYAALHPTPFSYVLGLYQDLLGRAPTDAELGFWLLVSRFKITRALLAGAFLNSDEHYGQTVADNYRRLLGREIASGEEAYWLSQLQSGRLDPDRVAEAFLTSDEFFTRELLSF